MVKLLDGMSGPQPYPQRSEDALGWLESFADSVEVDKTMGTIKVCAAFGGWGDIYLRVWGKGDNISRAANACADRVETMLSTGVVQL